MTSLAWMLGTAEICSSDTDLENKQIQMSGLALTGKGAPSKKRILSKLSKSFAAAKNFSDCSK